MSDLQKTDSATGTWVFHEFRAGCRECGWFSVIGYGTKEEAVQRADAHTFVNHSGLIRWSDDE